MHETSLPELRRRGRPAGSGIDDSVILTRVADTLAANPGMRPTTAMKQCVKGIPDTMLRRLQVKWKASGPALHQAAVGRRTLAEKARLRPTAAQVVYAVQSAMQGVGRFMESPALRSALEVMQQFATSPAMKAMQQVAEHYARHRALLDPPGLRLIREAERQAALAEPPALQHMKRLGYSQAAIDALGGGESPLQQQMRRMEEGMIQANPFGRNGG